MKKVLLIITLSIIALVFNDIQDSKASFSQGFAVVQTAEIPVGYTGTDHNFTIHVEQVGENVVYMTFCRYDNTDYYLDYISYKIGSTTYHDQYPTDLVSNCSRLTIPFDDADVVSNRLDIEVTKIVYDLYDGSYSWTDWATTGEIVSTFAVTGYYSGYNLFSDINLDGYDDDSYHAGGVAKETYLDSIYNDLSDSNNDGFDDSAYNIGASDLSTAYGGLSDTNSDGYDDGSYDAGYGVGVISDLDFSVFTQTLTFMGDIFQMEIFPNVTFGMLAMIPITFAIFRWFLKIVS